MYTLPVKYHPLHSGLSTQLSKVSRRLLWTEAKTSTFVPAFAANATSVALALYYKNHGPFDNYYIENKDGELRFLFYSEGPLNPSPLKVSYAAKAMC
jgi:hypothetical protein